MATQKHQLPQRKERIKTLQIKHALGSEKGQSGKRKLLDINHYTYSGQSVVPAPAAWASPGNLINCKFLSPTPVPPVRALGVGLSNL